jgi:hypothetical protein
MAEVDGRIAPVAGAREHVGVVVDPQQAPAKAKPVSVPVRARWRYSALASL